MIWTRPKLVGSIEAAVVGRPRDERFDHVEAMVLLHVSNQRPAPTKVTNWSLTATDRNGSRMKVQISSIPEGFQLTDSGGQLVEVSWNSANLVRMARETRLGWGDDMRGWLRISFPAVGDPLDIDGAVVILEVEDLSGRWHRVSPRVLARDESLPGGLVGVGQYFPA